MCDPVSLTVTAMAIQGGGALYGAQAAKKSGKAQQDYYNAIAANNEVAAEQAIKAGAIRENMTQYQAGLDTARLQRDASSLRARQTAVATAMGVGSGSVTSEDISTDTLSKQRMDELAIRYNADVEGWGAKTSAQNEAWDLKNQAGFNRMAGVNARTVGKNNAMASLIGGATSMASTAYGYSTYKAPRSMGVPTAG
jgi:hypothetical protein